MEDKTPCCNVPYAISKSTRWGTRLICNGCGKEQVRDESLRDFIFKGGLKAAEDFGLTLRDTRTCCENCIEDAQKQGTPCLNSKCECHSSHSVEVDWRDWVKTLSNSKLPADTDLLIAKIEVLLTSAEVRGAMRRDTTDADIAYEEAKAEGAAEVKQRILEALDKSTISPENTKIALDVILNLH